VSGASAPLLEKRNKYIQYTTKLTTNSDIKTKVFRGSCICVVSVIHCQREIVRDTDCCKIIMSVSGCGSNIVISRWCQGGGGLLQKI
jgi:hypothetical protein